MPNLAASVGRSMTTLTGDIAYKEEAKVLLGSIGKTLWLDSEKEIDIATALAGSGPAYLALVAEALADGAVKQGLKREHAMATMRGIVFRFWRTDPGYTPFNAQRRGNESWRYDRCRLCCPGRR